MEFDAFDLSCGEMLLVLIVLLGFGIPIALGIAWILSVSIY